MIPPERRAVYIQSTYDSALDSMRTESVTAAMAPHTAPGAEVQVSLRDCQQYGRPGKETARINSLYYNSIPVPRLRGAGGAASGSAGGGGAGASAPTTSN